MAYGRLCVSAIIYVLFLDVRHSSAECSGRIRINDTEGWIAVPSTGGTYSNNLQCTWFIENNSSMPHIRLKFNSFYTECLWDYLHVFDGDSIYGEKVAALSGQIVVNNDPLVVEANTCNDSSEGSGADFQPFKFETEFVLNGAQLFLYLFTDANAAFTGFNVSYWTSGCVDNCTDNGLCEEDSGRCTCDPGWTGEYCQYPTCPNSCAGHGACDGTQLKCKCDPGFTGYDCSIPTVVPHWKTISYTSPLGPQVLGRAGHSAVVYGQWMWVYGGYRFGDGQVTMSEAADFTSFLSEQGSQGDLVRYDFTTLSWEVPELMDGMSEPGPRYGHSAVVFNDMMFVYGGALLPSEEITNELWSLHLPSLTWTLVAGKSEMESSGSGVENDTTYLPVAVRDHTAHVVGNKMIILFGYSPDTNDVTLDLVQEFDLVDETWLAPAQFGDIPSKRMGQRSAYVPELGYVYVHGGLSITTDNSNPLSDLLAYDPVTRIWRNLATSPGTFGYHSLVALGGELVVFGGKSKSKCFQKEVLVYNILCDSWTTVDAHGLLQNSSRFGHSAVVDPNGKMAVFGGFIGQAHHDLLIFDSGNCSRFTERTECQNSSSGLCGWSAESNSCESFQLINWSDMILYCSENEFSSPIDECITQYSCAQCTARNSSGCVWNSATHYCINVLEVDNTTQLDDLVNSTNSCLAEIMGSCNGYKSCSTCLVHSFCEWDKVDGCNPTVDRNETTIFPVCETPENACSRTTSCSECSSLGGCLWCPSMQVCVTSTAYPYAFLYGQCLGWVNNSPKCPAENCQEPGCDLCQQQSGCGWCRDPADTGLGTCIQGGFLEPHNLTSCPDTHWFFDQCPLCNCNGHSQCIPETSICENCQNNTMGDHCEQCVNGLFGDPRYGNSCSLCDCNGYNDVCNNTDGNCVCLDAGVAGSRCTQCKASQNFAGDASNFCYYPMQVGFIYTFTVDPDQYQWFFAALPAKGHFLNFKFDIDENPYGQIVIVQLFLARFSEDFQILLNLTDPIAIEGSDYYSVTIQSFDTYDNNSGLFTFLREEEKNNESFVTLFDHATANSYSTFLWDGDVALIIYASNLTYDMKFRITIDQQDLLILLYFFTTFLTCFTLMLSGFFVGWYIKRKLEIRAYIRAQHIEMQRRVRRPFARIKTVVEKSVAVDAKQSASYISVEMCRDGRAAILTVLVRLPGDVTTGHPSTNRTGVCFGSTLVKMNSKPKDSKKKKKDSHHQSADETDTSSST